MSRVPAPLRRCRERAAGRARDTLIPITVRRLRRSPAALSATARCRRSRARSQAACRPVAALNFTGAFPRGILRQPCQKQPCTNGEDAAVSETRSGAPGARRGAARKRRPAPCRNRRTAQLRTPCPCRGTAVRMTSRCAAPGDTVSTTCPSRPSAGAALVGRADGRRGGDPLPRANHPAYVALRIPPPSSLDPFVAPIPRRGGAMKYRRPAWISSRRRWTRSGSLPEAAMLEPQVPRAL